MKTVYQTDTTGLFIGEAISHDSPLEPGVYLIPAGCVETAPPVAEIGHAAVWDGAAWALIEDHRGETWFDGNAPVVIDFVGNPIERGFTVLAPAPTFAEMCAAKIAAIVATAEALLGAGAPVDGGLHVALDNNARTDLTAMATTATNALSGALAWPESYAQGWISIENIRIPLATPADGLALAASVGHYYSAIVQNRRNLKDAVLVAEDAAALDAIDETAGWPA